MKNSKYNFFIALGEWVSDLTVYKLRKSAMSLMKEPEDETLPPPPPKKPEDGE